MRFARHLQEAGDAFRREELDSDDVRDRTVVDADWRDMRVGGFVSVFFFFCGFDPYRKQ